MPNHDRRREARQDHNEREGFWGRGHHGGGFHREERQDYSHEPYGVGAPDDGQDRYDDNLNRNARSGRGGDGGRYERAPEESSSRLGDSPSEFRREQDFRGRGPKGYRRSDARIHEDVNDRLADDPHLDASEIEVSVTDAEVTLAGSVDSRKARRRAEDLAEQVSGVSYVQNNIRIGGGECR